MVGRSIWTLTLILVFMLSISMLATNVSAAAADVATKNKPYILTPKPSDKPRINGAKIFGVRPGRPFLFTIPATGKRPIVFSAEGLPKGLKLDEKTGRITGVVDTCGGPNFSGSQTQKRAFGVPAKSRKMGTLGTYRVKLKAKNALGCAEREFRIVVGDDIALTPPMGWNSWNCWAREVSDENVRASAKAMVESGLIDHGWTYINIDDTWQGKRGSKYNAIQPNEKFHDMQGLCDYVHSLGLKIGIYSTPWVTSYAGHIGGSGDNENGSWEKIEGRRSYRKNFRHGKYKFDTNDVQQWNQWGIDYLKYDWRPNTVADVKRMANALRSCGRDIVYSLSNSAPFEHAVEWARKANCWRTTGDIRDVWTRSQLPKNKQWAWGVCEIRSAHRKWEQFNSPGHWNDPDMLVVGLVGWGKLHPSRLTPDEQYTHISLWCLWSAPLLLGCPLDKLDDFTINLLTNDEVLEVNQDPLGRQAELVVKSGDAEVWVKDMEDGSMAVGLFNLSLGEIKVKAKWSDIGIEGDPPRLLVEDKSGGKMGTKRRQTVRDLWRQKDLGVFEDEFEAKVPGHGVVLVKIAPPEGVLRTVLWPPWFLAKARRGVV